MTKINPEKIRNAQTILKRKKVFMFNQLLSLLSCSTRTGRLKLKQWHVHSSYNQNGRYYTLPSVPHFDEVGLWHYKDIYFSKHGTLKSTVIHLINKSSSGLTSNQIGKLVKLSPRSFLHHYRNDPGIQREKHGGVYVYFSDNPERYGQQIENYLNIIMLAAQKITDADAIVILTALIKFHQVSLEQIMALPEIKERRLSNSAVNEFLSRHDLLKKTPNTKL